MEDNHLLLLELIALVIAISYLVASIYVVGEAIFVGPSNLLFPVQVAFIATLFALFVLLELWPFHYLDSPDKWIVAGVELGLQGFVAFVGMWESIKNFLGRETTFELSQGGQFEGYMIFTLVAILAGTISLVWNTLSRLSSER